MTAPAEAELDLAFTWTVKDYVRARRAILLSRDVVSVMLLALAFGAVGIVAAGIFLYRNNHRVWLAPAIVLALLIAATLWFLLLGAASFSGRRQLATDRNLQQPIHQFFHQYGLTVKGRASQLTLGWKSIARILETADYVLFFYSASSAYFLPKRDVAAADLEALRALIRRYRPEVADLRDTAA